MNRHTQRKRPAGMRFGGVSIRFTAVLAGCALLVGGVFGGLIARGIDPNRSRLREAENRIEELENTLRLVGYDVDAEPLSFAFEPEESEWSAEDFIGLTADAEESGWNSDGLLGEMLTESTGEVIVAEFDGGVLTLSELAAPYNDRIAAQNISGADAEALLMEVMQELVADKICRARAEALGFTDRTPEDEAQIDRLTDEAWAELLRDYRDFVDTTGMDAQQSVEAIERFVAEELSITRESLRAEISDGYWFTRLCDWATQDVAVSEEEIQAKYEAMVEEQRLRFESDPEDYGYSVMNGETIAWNPEGYRRVKHILLTFDDSQIAAQAEELYLNIVEAQSSGAELSEVLSLQETLNELYSELDARAEEIETQLRQGADFDQMIAQYGADENMNEEPWRSEGYPVSPQSTYLYSQEFIDACMTMEYIGQVSQPAHSIAGTHIIRYIGDVAPGAVPLESLREVVTANALSEQRDDAFTTLEAQWINEANVRYFPERLQ